MGLTDMSNSFCVTACVCLWSEVYIRVLCFVLSPGTNLNRGNAYFLFPPKRPKELSAPERDSEAALIALNDASWCSQRSGLEGR